MEQQTFAEVSFEQYRKPTRRERFLDEMDRIVPWAELVAVIEPVYPKAEGPERPRLASNACYASIVCNSGSTCQIRRWRRRCMTREPCGSLSGLI